MLRRREKEEVLGLISTLKEVPSALGRSIEEDRALLTSAQEAAVRTGTFLEEKLGEGGGGLVPLLEEYCEAVYKASLPGGEGAREGLPALTERIGEAAQSLSVTYLVYFLPYQASMWDSLESVYLACLESDRIRPVVMPIPYYEVGPDKKAEMMLDGEGAYPEGIPLASWEETDLASIHPDAIFLHNVYDDHNQVTSVHPLFYTKRLMEETDCLVYIPYYANCGLFSEPMMSNPSLLNLDAMIVQSEGYKACARTYPYYDKLIVAGSPKFDRAIRMAAEDPHPPAAWEDLPEGQKRIMVNTTIDEVLTWGEEVFDRLREVFRIAIERKDFVLIWRPHPLLEATLRSMRHDLLKPYQDLVGAFLDEGIGILDETSDVTLASVSCDAHMSAGSSVETLFFVLDRPVYRFTYWKVDETGVPEDGFYRPGKFDVFAQYQGPTFPPSAFIDGVVTGSFGEAMEREKEEASSIAVNLDGTCGAHVRDWLLAFLDQGKKKRKK